MAFENRYGLALAAIVFAAVLDGLDGRLARFLKGTSRFGAELDSLADFVNFGVAPALILYFWGLHDLKSAGWIAAMAFAICASLRLARFNVMSVDPDRPAWAANFFVGVPAPAGAIIVLLPIYAAFLGLPRSPFVTWAMLVYTLVIAALMVSRLPVFSGKRVGTRVPPEMVGPVVILVVLCVALADRLSVDFAHGRHASVRSELAVRMGVLSRLRATIPRSQNRGGVGCERAAGGEGSDYYPHCRN